MSNAIRTRMTRIVSLGGLFTTLACGGGSETPPAQPAPAAEQAPACSLATTRAGGELVPAQAASHLRAFIHPPPSQAHAERMVLIAAAYAMNDTGRVPSWSPASVLTTFRAATRHALPRDAQEAVARADALIAEHLRVSPGCDGSATQDPG